jgi:hypothetical protein
MPNPRAKPAVGWGDHRGMAIWVATAIWVAMAIWSEEKRELGFDPAGRRLFIAQTPVPGDPALGPG